MVYIQMLSTYITAFLKPYFLFKGTTKSVLTYPIKQVNRYTHVVKT